jgi:hypothetical protein
MEEEWFGKYSERTMSQLKAMSAVQALFLAVERSDEVKVSPEGSRWRTRDISIAVARFSNVLNEWREAHRLYYMPEVELSEKKIIELFRCDTRAELGHQLVIMKILKVVWKWRQDRYGDYHLRMEPHEPVSRPSKAKPLTPPVKRKESNKE